MLQHFIIMQTKETRLSFLLYGPVLLRAPLECEIGLARVIYIYIYSSSRNIYIYKPFRVWIVFDLRYRKGRIENIPDACAT